MPERSKIKIKDENDKTLYEVKLDQQDQKKSSPAVKIILLIIAIPLSFAIGYFLFNL